MTSPQTVTAMFDDSAKVPDQACRAIHVAAETSVYAGSGWSGVRGKDFQEPSNPPAHGVSQYVVSFPSAAAASRLFDASTHSWQACTNRQYHSTTQPGTEGCGRWSQSPSPPTR
jgi:hypothetical protein